MLRQRSRPYLFSNSIPPMIAAAGIRMFDMMQESNELQDRLHENTDYFISKMKAAGFDIKPTESAICGLKTRPVSVYRYPPATRRSTSTDALPPSPRSARNSAY